MILRSNIVFYAFRSAGYRGWVWTPSLKGDDFNAPKGDLQMLVHQKTQSKLSRPISWNTMESDLAHVHQGSSLKTRRWRYITCRWCHRNLANTKTSVIAAKQTTRNEVWVLSLKYRCRDILLKTHKHYLFYEGLDGRVWYSLFIKNLAHHSSH